ncbi:hypothetical protein BJY52DRAFT_1232689, partial [Lactarius psammicola]
FHFLEEEGITESIADVVQAKFTQSGERKFEYQTLLTGGVASADAGKGKERVHERDTEVVKEERKTRETQQSTYYLTSVTTLGDNVTKGRHTELMDILQKHVFFGVVDPVCELCVVQVSTKLYLVNHGALVEEFLPARPTSVPQFRKA